jgi:hypothetical protein
MHCIKQEKPMHHFAVKVTAPLLKQSKDSKELERKEWPGQLWLQRYSYRFSFSRLRAALHACRAV